MYKYTDYHKTYGRIMQFNKNKKEPFHRWYPFVEGYSKEFIQSILDEMNNKDLVCLDPFSGSGTTALELQNSGLKCYAFEVNPLMYLIAKVKLENNYNNARLTYWHEYIIEKRKNLEVELITNFPTLYQEEDKKKWNYHTEVAIAVERLRESIRTITEPIYKDLFTVALAAILLEVSNLYRNGKCLSYKKEWKNKSYTEQEVFEKFDNKVVSELKCDICNALKPAREDIKANIYNEDARVGIESHIEDESIDLVITSPPYLNSRDYTDTYMLELKTLGFTNTGEEIRALREKTLRSHVQIKWDDASTVENKLLNATLKNLEKESKDIEKWNDSIIDMVRLYFVDMKKIFRVLYKKMKKSGKVYFNVSNSAYFNVLIKTLDICAEIAEEEGFRVIEIREARFLKTSPQQKEKIGKLLEGVIVLEK